MASPTRPPDPIGALALAVFKLGGRLTEGGNQLVADLGLTAASWQVVGALSLAGTPLPAAHIARNMGLARQSVQRLVDRLAEDGLVRFAPNRHHRRAKLVVLTEAGEAALGRALERQKPWADDLLAQLGVDHVTAAVDLLERMDALLAGGGPQDTREEDDA